jgi:hypothetical protein
MSDDKSIDAAGQEQGILRHGLRRALGRLRAKELASDLVTSRKSSKRPNETVRRQVDLAHALLDGGRITEDEHLLFSTFPVEHLHHERWMEGAYPEIEALSKEMEGVEQAAGLSKDQYWMINDAPPEYITLSTRYDASLDARFAEMLDQFGLTELAVLWRTDRAEYDRRRENGRRAIFEKDNVREAVSGSVRIYEAEAMRSATAGAYYAACVMLGSAAEARLLSMCLDNPSRLTEVLALLPRSEAPRNRDPLHWSLEHLILIAGKAGWLVDLEDDDIKLNVAQWLISLRDTRNLLHPGRHARDRPHAIVGPELHSDSLLAYQALCIGLERQSVRAQIEQALEDAGTETLST